MKPPVSTLSLRAYRIAAAGFALAMTMYALGGLAPRSDPGSDPKVSRGDSPIGGPKSCEDRWAEYWECLMQGGNNCVKPDCDENPFGQLLSAAGL